MFSLSQVATLCTPQGNETTLPLGSATRKDLVVPASSVGKIIGRSGEMVRELQSRSLAKIQVDHTAKVYKADTRLVSIVGTPEAVVKAEEMIMFLVANPLMDAMKAIRMLVDDKMQRGGRWGSGPPYVNMPNQGYNMTPVESGFNQPPPPQQYSGYHQAGPPSGPVFGGPPMQHGFGGYTERGPETEYFPAAKMYMGRIIGQKGVTINDLQKRSGCDIQINQDVPPGQDCIVTIKGSRQKIEMAKQMLREIIEMGPNHPYAGGGGRKSVFASSMFSLRNMHHCSNLLARRIRRRQQPGLLTTRASQPVYAAAAAASSSPDARGIPADWTPTWTAAIWWTLAIIRSQPPCTTIRAAC